ncbi:D-3-phosphoglycerate dehydrogenase, partial [Globisporangium splendens]
MSATTTKLRVLCLHGFRTNVKVMQNQTATLRALLGDDAEFTFLNGPYKAKGPSAEGIQRQYSNDAPFYEWCALGYVQGLDKDKEDADAAKTEWRELYIGFEKAAEFLDAHLRQYGPYDVVIGFSQGAAVLTILSMIYLRKQPSQRWWNLCVCVGGVPVRDVSMRPMFEKPNGELILLPFPSIHIMGRKDSLYKDSIQLAAMYEDRPAGSVMKKLVFEHNGGHNFPPAKHNPGFYENLADLIRQHCGLQPTSAQPKRVALYASLSLTTDHSLPTHPHVDESSGLLVELHLTESHVVVMLPTTNDCTTIKCDLSLEVSATNVEQTKGGGRVEGSFGRKFYDDSRCAAAQADAATAVPSSQREEGGAPDPVRTNEPDQVNAGTPDESGTNEVDPSGGDDAMAGRHDTAPTTVEGVHKAAATETASQERYEALTAKM